MGEPSDHDRVLMNGVHAFFDPYNVTKFFGQTSTLEFVRESETRHRRPRGIGGTGVTYGKLSISRSLVGTYSVGIKHQTV